MWKKLLMLKIQKNYTLIIHIWKYSSHNNSKFILNMYLIKLSKLVYIDDSKEIYFYLYSNVEKYNQLYVDNNGKKLSSTLFLENFRNISFNSQSMNNFRHEKKGTKNIEVYEWILIYFYLCIYFNLMYNFKGVTSNKPYMGDDDEQCYSTYYIYDSEEVLFKITYTEIGKTLKCGTLHADNSMYIQNILIYLLNSINLVRAVRDSENQKDKSKFYIIAKDKNLYEIGNFYRNQIINLIISLNLMILLMICGDTGALLNPGPVSNKNTPNTNRSPDRNTNMHIAHTQERGRRMERGGETR